jgi:hypothetical protein
MESTRKPMRLVEKNLELATKVWGNLPETTSETLTGLTKKYALVVSAGDLILLDRRWYVTHSGLLGLARRKRCAGIHVKRLGSSAIPRDSVGPSRRQCTGPELVEDFRATAMPIRPMCLPWSTGPR